MLPTRQHRLPAGGSWSSRKGVDRRADREPPIEQGCSVVGPAPGLDSALALARSEPLDAAILDVNLSGSRSHAVADMLRQHGIPFIALTGYADSGLAAAFDGAPVVAKPFDGQALLNTLAQEISDGLQHRVRT